ncbi:LysR family transcriptional regulator [Alkalihalophilus pseudofirmus]|uniref:LysR family transcriptional regulator n=1 Tax=Alkalihalophilus pseudofirmus TaxID=79885 RepID=UPI00259B8796|nr:LysR family transcriptional regulator [Alkalihalophilus pseudofirmus]WEG17240.1 LysR family transcriptional regulator [Alkalihalophilus pseudofirmus]
MQLDWIRSYVTLVHFQHFTKTSEYLNLSQPTISIHIKKLEDYLGVKLIERSLTNRSFTLTSAGQEVFEQGKKMLEISRSIEQVKEKKEEVSLRIGATNTVSDVILPDFVKKIRVLYPQIRLQLMIHNHEQIVEGLEQHKLDLALVEGTSGLGPFHVEVVSRDELRFYAKQRMPLATSPLLLREKGSGTREYADQFLLSERIEPSEIIEASSHYLIKQLAIRGLGIAFLSHSMVKEEVSEGKLVPLNLHVIYRPFYAVYEEEHVHTPILKELCDLLQSIT